MTPSASSNGRGASALASLRRYVRPRATPVAERCGLCDTALPDEHAHLLEPATGRLACACEACALLFSGPAGGRYHRVPRRSRKLVDFQLDDGGWDRLALPIDLAFLVRSSPARAVVARYPSPAGATESSVASPLWDELVADNPVLAAIEPDVEALLVNRVSGNRLYFLVGIDVCYRLVGVIRTKWRGLSGGREAWDEIARLFEDLDRRSTPAVASGNGRAHA